MNYVVGVVYTNAGFGIVLHISNFWARKKSSINIVLSLQFFWNWPSIKILNHTFTKYEYFLFVVIVIWLICRCFYIFFLICSWFALLTTSVVFFIPVGFLLSMIEFPVFIFLLHIPFRFLYLSMQDQLSDHHSTFHIQWDY